MKRRDVAVIAAAFGLALAVFLLYFLAYRTRRYAMPVGFDAPWYVWRARFVGAEGIGPVGTSARPGHAVLASILSGLTGLSQLTMAVVLPLALASVFALAVGAFWRAALGEGRMAGWGWVLAAAVSGTLLGASRLVGENVANLLLLALVMVALAATARRVEGHPGWWAATILLVGAGLAHWMFLAVVLAILAAAAVLGLPASLRQRQEGTPWGLTESGVVAGSAAAASGAIAMLVVGVLRTSFRTYEIKEDIRRYRPKLRTDVSRLFLPGLLPASLLGVAALVDRGRRARFREPLGFALRVMLSWAAISLIGLAYGAITLDVPPHRFLALLVAVPGAIALATAVDWIAELVRRRSGVLAAGIVAAVAVAALAVPGMLAWYRHGPGVWINPNGLQQAKSASAYVARLPRDEPVVFLVSTRGQAGLISVPLKERVIRAGLSPGQQTRVHFFAGEPSDVLAGRQTPVRSERLRESLQTYWEDVRTVLPRDPPIVILEGFARRQFDEAVNEDGATVVAPGVAVLRGPAGEVPAGMPPRPVPRTVTGALWGLALLGALFIAGSGWTRLVLGSDAPAALIACSMPAVGCAVLMIGGLVAAKAGVRLGGVGGAVTFALIAAGGIVAALWVARSRRTEAEDSAPPRAPSRVGTPDT